MHTRFVYYSISDRYSNYLAILFYSGTYQAPKVGSDDQHRLIFLLYRSKEPISASPIIEQEKRRQFPLKQFVEENELTLLAATACTIDGTIEK